jgi:hypothetical protein
VRPLDQLDLGRPYTNLSRATVSSVTLQPNTADVVKPVVPAGPDCNGTAATIVGTASAGTICGSGGADTDRIDGGTSADVCVASAPDTFLNCP